MALFMEDRWSEPEGGGATPEFIPLWGNLGADPMIIVSSFEEKYWLDTNITGLVDSEHSVTSATAPSENYT